MSSITYCLIPALYSILAALFLGLAIYSRILGLRLPKIKKEDLVALNEVGRHIFFTTKLSELLLKLPVLVHFVS